MNPDKLAKIKALAEDSRGDPATREIARRAYARYAKEPFQETPRWEPPRNPQHEGLKTGAEYDKFRFMDLGSWRTAKATGNPWHITKHKGIAYHFVLFRHKKSPTWGWVRTNQITDHVEFSGRFATLAEAHANAWTMLQTI